MVQEDNVETWKPVVGYEDTYEVSDLGRVRNVIKGFVLKQSNHGRGYKLVSLHRKNKLVHVLVMTAFEGPADGKTTNHKDGDKGNNKRSNLEYLTLLENVHHAMHALGYWFKGEKHGHSKLTKGQVVKIRKRRATGERLQTIANDFNCSIQHVSDLALNKRWRHLS